MIEPVRTRPILSKMESLLLLSVENVMLMKVFFVLVTYILMTAKYLQHGVIPSGHPSKF